MVIKIGPELETALTERARQQGVTPETLAVNALRERFLVPATQVKPPEEWERLLRQAASDCGVSLPHSALSSEGLYE
jgi:hypothetical protein